jgi:hypothetical protein
MCGTNGVINEKSGSGHEMSESGMHKDRGSKEDRSEEDRGQE